MEVIIKKSYYKNNFKKKIRIMNLLQKQEQEIHNKLFTKLPQNSIRL